MLRHLGCRTGGAASNEYLRDLRQRLLRTADALLTSVQVSHARQAAADGAPTAGIATQTAGQSLSLASAVLLLLFCSRRNVLQRNTDCRSVVVIVSSLPAASEGCGA